MSDFVLVRHDNGHIGPESRAFAVKRGLEIVDGPALTLTGKPVKVVRNEAGRPVLPKTSVAKSAAEKAVTPTEGPAETTLTETKE